MIQNLEIKDIPSVARLHHQELDGLLSELGLPFLEKFYRISLLIPSMWIIVKKENDHILGFVTCITSTEGLYKKVILRDILGFTKLFLSIFITQPELIIKTVKTLTYPGFSHNNPELLTMVIGKRHQKKGIGRELFNECVREFKKRKIKKFLVSAYDKLPANGFYKHIGCKLKYNFIFLGEKMNYYGYESK